MIQKETANFFWHGDLTRLELTAIKSFVYHGFNVNFWNYDGKHVDGCVTRDANEILPQSDLIKYYYIHPVDVINGVEPHPSLAAFSDVFRIKLLNDVGGWWFDTDCICLTNQHNYYRLRQEQSFIAGLEDDKSIASGVLFVGDDYKHKLMEKMQLILDRYSTNDKNEIHLGQWGILGPAMITEFMHEHGLRAVSKDAFYQWSYYQIDYFVNPAYTEAAIEGLKYSFLIHAWDSLLQKNNFNKNVVQHGTLLDYLYKKYER